jgi:hypothetical protein
MQNRQRTPRGPFLSSANGHPLLESVERTVEHLAESKSLGATPRRGQCRYRNVVSCVTLVAVT